MTKRKGRAPKLEATVTEAKKTTADREGRDKSNDVKETGNSIR